MVARASASIPPFLTQDSYASVSARFGKWNSVLKCLRVCSSPRKCPPAPTWAITSRASVSSLTGTPAKKRGSISSISASRTIASKDAVNPPSSQPAPCRT